MTDADPTLKSAGTESPRLRPAAQALRNALRSTPAAGQSENEEQSYQTFQKRFIEEVKRLIPGIKNADLYKVNEAALYVIPNIQTYNDFINSSPAQVVQAIEKTLASNHVELDGDNKHIAHAALTALAHARGLRNEVKEVAFRVPDAGQQQLVRNLAEEKDKNMQLMEELARQRTEADDLRRRITALEDASRAAPTPRPLSPDPKPLPPVPPLPPEPPVPPTDTDTNESGWTLDDYAKRRALMHMAGAFSQRSGVEFSPDSVRVQKAAALNERLYGLKRRTWINIARRMLAPLTAVAGATAAALTAATVGFGTAAFVVPALIGLTAVGGRTWLNYKVNKKYGVNTTIADALPLPNFMKAGFTRDSRKKYYEERGLAVDPISGRQEKSTYDFNDTHDIALAGDVHQKFIIEKGGAISNKVEGFTRRFSVLRKDQKRVQRELKFITDKIAALHGEVIPVGGDISALANRNDIPGGLQRMAKDVASRLDKINQDEQALVGEFHAYTKGLDTKMQAAVSGTVEAFESEINRARRNRGLRDLASALPGIPLGMGMRSGLESVMTARGGSPVLTNSLVPNGAQLTPPPGMRVVPGAQNTLVPPQPNVGNVNGLYGRPAGVMQQVQPQTGGGAARAAAEVVQPSAPRAVAPENAYISRARPDDISAIQQHLRARYVSPEHYWNSYGTRVRNVMQLPTTDCGQGTVDSIQRVFSRYGLDKLPNSHRAVVLLDGFIDPNNGSVTLRGDKSPSSLLAKMGANPADATRVRNGLKMQFLLGDPDVQRVYLSTLQKQIPAGEYARLMGAENNPGPLRKILRDAALLRARG